MTSTRESIAEGYKIFELAFFRGDADTIAGLYTEDAQLLVPEAPIFSGRTAIAEIWRVILGAGGSSVKVTTGEVQEVGDWAYEVGAFTTSAPGGEVLNVGKFVVVWRREANGAWKIHRDIFNWDIPPANPS